MDDDPAARASDDRHAASGSNLAPILEIALSDPSKACRLAASEALVTLRPPADLTMKVAHAIRRVLFELSSDDELAAETIRVAALIPVRSVRVDLGKIAGTPDTDLALIAAIELAKRGDPAGIETLVSAVRGSQPMLAAESLAALPLESLDVAPQWLLDTFEASRDGDLRVWLSIALGRVGYKVALQQVFEALLRDDTAELPTMFRGDPWTSYDRLAAVRPLPDELQRFVAELYESAARRQKPGVRGETNIPRDARLLAGGLTGIVNAEGHRLPEGVDNDMPPQTADALTEATALLEEFKVRRESGMPGATNDVLFRMASLPSTLDFSPAEWLDRLRSVGDRLPGDVAWVLSRAGLRRIVEELGEKAASERDASRRLAVLHNLTDVALRTGTHPPYGGAGGSQTVTPQEQLINDVPIRLARVRRSASLPRVEPPERARVEGAVRSDAEPPEPAREAWPHLKCDERVFIGTPFELEVGLASQQDCKVEGTGALTLPSGSFMLTAEIMFDPSSFAIASGTRVMQIPVASSGDYPVRSVKLVALKDDRLQPRRRIGVTYSIEGSMRGYAAREVQVVDTAAEPAATLAPATTAAALPLDLSPFDGADEADLTIIIRHGDDAAGRTLHFAIRGPGIVPVERDPQTMECDIGSRPDAFLALYLRKGSSTNAPLDLSRWLIGRGRIIGGKLPQPVQDALRSAAARAGGKPPTVLIISEDPYVPWELAVLEPPLQPNASPFLGAQAVIGRWVLATDRPPVRPMRQKKVGPHVIVSGDYQGVPGWRQLKNAQAEAQDLARWTPTCTVDATFESVTSCLEGNPAGDVLHFALHGKFDPTGLGNGLVLIQGTAEIRRPIYLEPDHVRAGTLDSQPFVFLNACQVAGADEVLGDYAGMAAAFLFAGASAVVAPLWSIDDGAARQIAVSFYERVYEKHEPPAEVFRSHREAAGRPGKDPEASTDFGTHLAYQFFGHPRLLLERKSS